jgi:hypothetical protein
VTYAASTLLATLLVAGAIGCLCQFAFIEPTTTRAALEKAAPGDRA